MEEKAAHGKAKDDSLQLSFKLEVLKKEYDTIVSNLDSERSRMHAAKVSTQGVWNSPVTSVQSTVTSKQPRLVLKKEYGTHQ